MGQITLGPYFIFLVSDFPSPCCLNQCCSKCDLLSDICSQTLVNVLWSVKYRDEVSRNLYNLTLQKYANTW